MVRKASKITFRPGENRNKKLEQYKKNYEKLTGKNISRTKIIVSALDTLLDTGNLYNDDIQKYEQIIIKMVTGYRKFDFENDEEYLGILSSTVKRISGIIENVEQGDDQENN